MSEVKIEVGDTSSPEVQRRVRATEISADKAIKLIINRTKNMETREGTDHVLNAIGVMCANAVSIGGHLGEEAGARAVAALIVQHMENRLRHMYGENSHD